MEALHRLHDKMSPRNCYWQVLLQLAAVSSVWFAVGPNDVQRRDAGHHWTPGNGQHRTPRLIGSCWHPNFKVNGKSLEIMEDITPCFCWNHFQDFLWICIWEALLAGGTRGAGTVFATAPRRVSTNGIQASKALCFHALPTRSSFGTTPRLIHRSHLQPAIPRFWFLRWASITGSKYLSQDSWIYESSTIGRRFWKPWNSKGWLWSSIRGASKIHQILFLLREAFRARSQTSEMNRWKTKIAYLFGWKNQRNVILVFNDMSCFFLISYIRLAGFRSVGLPKPKSHSMSFYVVFFIKVIQQLTDKTC